MQKKQIFTKLFVFIFLATSLGSCSSSDEPMPEIAEDTFLKKFDGTKWEYIADSGNIYIFKFNDDELNPYVLWFKEENASCYGFYKTHIYNFEIKELTADKFNIYIEYRFGNTINYFHWDFAINEKGNITIDGNDMTEVDKLLVVCGGN